jgi:regulatory protein
MSASRQVISRPGRSRATDCVTGADAFSDPQRTERAAYQKALQRLAVRDHSQEELRRALKRHGHAPADIEHALARLEKARLIDDRVFAERFARRALSRGLGGKRIGLALSQRGVPRDLARDGLNHARGETPEATVLDAVARAYWRRNARVDREKRLRRLWAFLLRRGFPTALVARRLRAAFPDLDDALDGLASGSS